MFRRAKRKAVYFLFGICSFITGSASAQQAPGSSNTIEYTKWVSEVEGGNPNASLSDGTWVRLGEYDTYQEASRRSQEYYRQHPGSPRLTREREVTFRQTLPRSGPSQSPPQGAMPGPAPAPGNFGPPPVQLEGTWTGSENLQGFGRLQFRFEANGRVVMTDAQNTVAGRWYRNGNAIHLSFYNGNCDYFGTISGNQISGRATANNRSWTWTVSR
jgi:hypothetical protein